MVEYRFEESVEYSVRIKDENGLLHLSQELYVQIFGLNMSFLPKSNHKNHNSQENPPDFICQRHKND